MTRDTNLYENPLTAGRAKTGTFWDNLGKEKTKAKQRQKDKISKQEGINIHEPLLLFLSLWHCLGVHIYWDFSLEQAMTGPTQDMAKGESTEKRGRRWQIEKKNKKNTS